MHVALQDVWARARTLRRDGDYVVFRSNTEADGSTIVVVATASEQPQPRSVERLQHEYALCNKLDPAFAAKPLTLAQQHGRSMLVLADCPPESAADLNV